MNKHTVLVVDDEPKILESLSIILEEDFNILIASNGKEGLTVFNANPNISMILLDIDMPIMNGVEALESIRDVNSKVIVLIMTGKSCHEYASSCADLHIHGYMKKPVEPEKLINRIKELLSIDDYQVLHNYWKGKYARKWTSNNPTVKRALTYIHQNIHKCITREDVSNYLEMTPDHLCKMLKKECDLGTSDYINRYRIFKCQEYLISNPNITINQAAARLGISDTNYFGRVFKKYTGLTPTEFKRNSLTI